MPPEEILQYTHNEEETKALLWKEECFPRIGEEAIPDVSHAK